MVKIYAKAFNKFFLEFEHGEPLPVYCVVLNKRRNDIDIAGIVFILNLLSCSAAFKNTTIKP